MSKRNEQCPECKGEGKTALLGRCWECNGTGRVRQEEIDEAPLCGSCGGKMSKNPHPDAGKPSDFLTVGTRYVCIPCTIKSRHSWAERAMKAEGQLDDSRKEVEKIITTMDHRIESLSLVLECENPLDRMAIRNVINGWQALK